MKPRIVIVMEGGVIQNIMSDVDVEVSLIDHDSIGEGNAPSVGGVAVEINKKDVARFRADPFKHLGLNAEDFEDDDPNGYMAAVLRFAQDPDVNQDISLDELYREVMSRPEDGHGKVSYKVVVGGERNRSVTTASTNTLVIPMYFQSAFDNYSPEMTVREFIERRKESVV